jgi:hypothetical protein
MGLATMAVFRGRVGVGRQRLVTHQPAASASGQFDSEKTTADFVPGTWFKSQRRSARLAHLAASIHDDGAMIWTACSVGFFSRDVHPDNEAPKCSRCTTAAYRISDSKK